MTYTRYKRPLPPLPPIETLPFPANAIRQCESCSLRKVCRAPVPGHGLIPARVMFIGEAPGGNEDDQNIPFIGQAGKQFDDLLYKIGSPREIVYVTNVVKCRPPGNRTPYVAEMNACSKWLDTEIRIVNPRIVVLMGATAIRRIMADKADTLEHLHGRPFMMELHGENRIILPTYHPAASLYDSSLLRQLYSDFEVLRGLNQNKPLSDFQIADEYPDPVYRVADTPELFEEMSEEIRKSGRFAVDVETAERDSLIWSVQISTKPGTAWFIPIKDGTKRFDCTQWGEDIRVIVHYYLNDIKFLILPERNFSDTMIMAYLLGSPQGLKTLAIQLCGMHMITYKEMVRPEQAKLALKYLSEVVSREWSDSPLIEDAKWDNKAGKIVVRMKKPWHILRKAKKILADAADNPEVDPYDRWFSIPEPERAEVEKAMGLMPESALRDIKFEDAVQYSSRDPDATLRVYLKMVTKIQEAGLAYVEYLGHGILPMVREMMESGFGANVQILKDLSVELSTRMEEQAALASGIVGHPFNPNSSPQVAAVVYGELGFKPTAYTETKQISTDDQELKKVNHPIVRPILEYRRLLKLKGTYTDNLVAQSVLEPETGTMRIHTTIKTTRTETGRLSSADPNEQNIPTRSKEGKRIRTAFIATPKLLTAREPSITASIDGVAIPPWKVKLLDNLNRRGGRLFEGDYGQIEVVSQAHLANCAGLIELFRKGLDPHTVTASKIFGVSYEEAKKSKYRYPVKRANFGIIYMIGAEGLSNQIHEYIADLIMAGEPVDVEPWSVQQCEEFIAEWYGLYPEVKNYQMDKVAQARRFGYVTDLFGRRRYIPEVFCPIKSVSEAGARQAANMPVQSSAQGIIQTAMVNAWRALPDSGYRELMRFVMQIHDSLVGETVDDDVISTDFLHWLGKIMVTAVKLRVPVKVDFKSGYNWSETKTVLEMSSKEFE